MTIAVESCRELKNHDLSNLTVSLTDERYGVVGHFDENWQQILNLGFDLPGANMYRQLIGKSREETTVAFNNWLKDQFQINDYKIALFGIGSDGHTAGIKPGSAAITSNNLAASFTGNDFERITITFPGILKLDEAITQASGVDKKPIIKNLLNDAIDITIQPAQILKQIPISIFFSNNKKEDL